MDDRAQEIKQEMQVEADRVEAIRDVLTGSGTAPERICTMQRRRVNSQVRALAAARINRIEQKLNRRSIEAKAAIQRQAFQHERQAISTLAVIMNDDKNQGRERATAAKELIRLAAGEFRGQAGPTLRSQNTQVVFNPPPAEERDKYQELG